MKNALLVLLVWIGLPLVLVVSFFPLIAGGLCVAYGFHWLAPPSTEWVWFGTAALCVWCLVVGVNASSV